MYSSTPVAVKVLRALLRRGFALLALALVLAWLAASPTTRPQLSPAPEGAYPSSNTAEGADALFSLTSGVLQQRPVRMRSLTIPPAATTRPMVHSRSPMASPPTTTTRPPVSKHLKLRLVITTPPPVRWRCRPILPATIE